MRLIRSIYSPHLPTGGCALTIGNFDAVHIGHQKILNTLVQQAAKRRLPAVVMTFDPHPQEYFRAAAASARLTTTTMRFFALRECNVDIMLSLRFNRDLSRTSAEQFICHYLAEQLRVKYLLIGDDFRFGAQRAGNFKMLAQMATRYGYQVQRIDTLKRHDTRVSSTWLRELLGAGCLEQAARLLGRNYVYIGRVMHGDKRGREWGFPTLNLAVRHPPAISGVFAVRVSGLAEEAIAGVASLGTRPTVEETTDSAARRVQNLLEVYLFDYVGDAYGQRIGVEFVQKLRDEGKFADYAALRKQIAQDVEMAKRVLLGTATTELIKI